MWTDEKHILALEVMDLVNQCCDDRKRVLRDLARTLKAFTDLDAVAIHWHESDHSVHCAAIGFGDDPRQVVDFSAKNDSTRTEGFASLFVYGFDARFEQISKAPGASSTSSAEHKSFWTNSFSDLHESGLPHHGRIAGSNDVPVHESVAIVPLLSDQGVIGLIQLSDRRKDRFSEESVSFLERLGKGVGVALANAIARADVTKRIRELERRADRRNEELVRINDNLRMEIAKRERIEEALSQSEARYRTLVETAKDIIWTADMNLRFLYVSPSITPTLGYTRQEMMEQDFLDTLAPSSRNIVLRVITEELDTQENPGQPMPRNSRTLELEQRRKDGTMAWMEVTATFMRDKNGHPLGILGVSRDVSERKQIEQIKTDFMSTAAHEIQTPITSILGFSELLLIRDDLSPQETRECLTRIHTQAGNLASLVSKLLEVWKSQTDREAPEPSQPWPVRETVEKIVDSFRGQSRIHRFESVFPEQPVNLRAHPKSISEALTHILANAVKYSPQGGVVRLTCRIDEGRCQFSIEDQGIGMTPEQVERVFDRFYRSNTSDTAVSGLGIGMSLVKNLVEAEGGRVWVESGYGKGSTVSFYVPV